MSIESDALRDTAAKCRRVAAEIGDRKTADALAETATDYEHRADRMEESERHLREAETASPPPPGRPG